jgi:hypothetical protein
MSHCKTCKHWQPYRDRHNNGSCDRLRDELHTPGESLVTLLWSDTSITNEVIQDTLQLVCVNEQFGCVLHEPKE